MSRFYATIQGGRGEASRAGHKFIRGHVRGWNLGVRVEGGLLATDESKDVQVIYATGGSRGARRDVCLGSVRETPDGRVLLLDTRIATALGLPYDCDVNLDAV
jgi:hypothetical protein